MWLLKYVEGKIDFRQFGGIKGNSITHYLIEFVNFILSNQDNKEPTVILACMIDFSQAFNRQNHNILITKLSDLGVPAWLLKTIMSFLENRRMVVRYKGATSSIKDLPGGGPQGTLLGLFLFIILINDVGFENQLNNVGDIINCKKMLKEANQIHLKYIDDLTIAESLPIKKSVRSIPMSERIHPESYHERTGHALLPHKSQVLQQMGKIQKYAKDNDMKLNLKKTKFMLFNRCRNYDFLPKVTMDGAEIELVEQIKILGIILTSDLKFHKNTEFIIKKAFKRIWILRRLKSLNATNKQLLEIYKTQVRSSLETAVPLWQSSLTISNKENLERVQKVAFRIIYGSDYVSYKNACRKANIIPLAERRNKLCKKFAFKTLKHPKHKMLYKPNKKAKIDKRLRQEKFVTPVTRTVRFENSPIPFLTRILNNT